MQGVETIEVGVAPVHHVEGPGLGDQEVEHVDLVQLAIGDVDKARNGSPQIEQRVQPDRRLGRAEARPREDRQTQVDGRGIQRIDRLGQRHAQRLARIERSRLGDQPLGEFGINAPVARLVGIGQRRAADRLAKPHVVELGGLGRQTGLDVAQALAVGELREGHAAQLLGARQRAHAVIAAVTGHDAVKVLPRQEVHDLRKQRLANVHDSLRPNQSRKGGHTGQCRSSRRHLAISQKPCRYRVYNESRSF